MESVGISGVEESNVSEDLDILEREFGYWRPMMEEEEAAAEDDEDPWQSSGLQDKAMATFKEWRKGMLIEAHKRFLARRQGK